MLFLEETDVILNFLRGWPSGQNCQESTELSCEGEDGSGVTLIGSVIPAINLSRPGVGDRHRSRMNIARATHSTYRVEQKKWR